MRPALAAVEQRASDALAWLGGLGTLAGRTLARAPRRPLGLGAIAAQIDAIGVASLSVAVLTAVFSSMVMTVQFAVQLGRFGAREHVGQVVALSLVRELGPVLTALMVGGRVGAGIAAELGSMRVSEQIDALRSMGADPIKELVVPRVAAAIVCLPLLTLLANLLGVVGAMGIARLDSGENMRLFWQTAIQKVDVADLMGGLAKTLCFGATLSLIACYEGLSTVGGTRGVGRAATRTVVFASIVTLVSDFFLTKLLLRFGL